MLNKMNLKTANAWYFNVKIYSTGDSPNAKMMKFQSHVSTIHNRNSIKLLQLSHRRLYPKYMKYETSKSTKEEHDEAKTII